jgi:hypothetical protein
MKLPDRRRSEGATLRYDAAPAVCGRLRGLQPDGGDLTG